MDIKADSFWVNYIRVNNSSQKIHKKLLALTLDEC